MMQEQDYDTIRHRLEKELSRLRGDEMDQDSSHGQRGEANLDRADLAQSYSRRERNLALRDVQREKAAHIEKALQRIVEGGYGKCMSCEQPIAPGRLEIIPYTVYCIDCQAKFERSP